MKVRAMILGLAITAVASAAGPKPPWPNIAVDESIVREQAQKFGAHCRQQYQSRPDIDCNCFAEKYPQARLEVLSDTIYYWDASQRASCGNFGDACDTAERNIFRWFLEAKTQKNYPTKEGLPLAKRVRGPAGSTLEQMFTDVTLKVGDRCANLGHIGAEAEKRCLQNVRSGLLKLKPGQSTIAYCGCVKQKIGESQSESDSLIQCGRN